MQVLIEAICRECKPRLFLSGPREDEHHIGTRFGRADSRLRVRIDGTDRSRYVFEVKAGNPGTAFIYCGDVSLFEGSKHKCCNCGQHACSAIVRGSVAVGTARAAT